MTNFPSRLVFIVCVSPRGERDDMRLFPQLLPTSWRSVILCPTSFLQHNHPTLYTLCFLFGKVTLWPIFTPIPSFCFHLPSPWSAKIPPPSHIFEHSLADFARREVFLLASWGRWQAPMLARSLICWRRRRRWNFHPLPVCLRRWWSDCEQRRFLKSLLKGLQWMFFCHKIVVKKVALKKKKSAETL